MFSAARIYRAAGGCFSKDNLRCAGNPAALGCCRASSWCFFIDSGRYLVRAAAALLQDADAVYIVGESAGAHFYGCLPVVEQEKKQQDGSVKRFFAVFDDTKEEEESLS